MPSNYPSGGAPPSGPASGDLSGTYPSPTVAKIQTKPISTSTPALNDVLTWNGTAWAPAAGGGGGGGTITAVTASSPLASSGGTSPDISLSGTVAVANGGTGAATANANVLFAGPTTGSAAAPAFRALVANDLPSLSPDPTGTYTNADITVDAHGRVTAAASGTVSLTTEVSGILPVANGGTNAATATAAFVFAGPTSGSAAAPSFRALGYSDLPTAAVGIFAISATSGTVAIDLTAGAVQTQTVSGTTTYSVTGASATLAYGVSVVITASGTQTVNFDANWKWVGVKPTQIATGTVAMLTLMNSGANATDVIAAWQVLG